MHKPPGTVLPHNKQLVYFPTDTLSITYEKYLSTEFINSFKPCGKFPIHGSTKQITKIAQARLQNQSYKDHIYKASSLWVIVIKLHSMVYVQRAVYNPKSMQQHPPQIIRNALILKKKYLKRSSVLLGIYSKTIGKEVVHDFLINDLNSSKWYTKFNFLYFKLFHKFWMTQDHLYSQLIRTFKLSLPSLFIPLPDWRVTSSDFFCL